MDIINLLTEQLNSKTVLNKIGKSAGAKPTEVKKVTELALPTLIKAMQANASTAKGASALSKALDEHKDDEVSNIAGFLDKVDLGDGAKILEHVFSNKNQNVQKDIAKKTGLNSNQVSGIMTQLAPLLLGALGNQKKEKDLSASGVSGLLDIVSGQVGGEGLANMAASILGVGSGNSTLGQVGGLLGKLFSTSTAKETTKKKTKK